MQNIFNRIIKVSIYLLVFLLPLFWLPFSFEAFEYNKQYLLFFLVSLSLFAWLAKMVLVDKEIRFKRTPLDLPVLVFLFVAILSALFSVDKSSSWFGFYGRFSDGLLGLLSLGALYFLITNNVGIRAKLKTPPSAKAQVRRQNEEEKNYVGPAHIISVNGLIKALIWSAFFVILISYLSVFGVWNKLSLPAVMLQRTFNPVAGSMEALAVFLAVAIVFLVGRILLKLKGGKLSSIINYLLVFALLFLLFIIDFGAAWIIISVSLILFVGFALWKRMLKERVNRLLLPIFLIVIALVFLATDLARNVLVNLPQEQVLNQGESWGIGFKSATDNVKSGFLGSGIGTWHYDFSKFKSVEFNQNWLWQIRFDRPGSHLAEILGTMGFLGLLSYFFLIGFFFLLSYLLLQTLVIKSQIPGTKGARQGGRVAGGLESQTNSPEGPPTKFWWGTYQAGQQLPLLMMFLALLVGQFVYYQNTVLAFTFWLVLGLSVVSWQKPIAEKAISFKDFPELSLVFSALLIISGLSFLGMYFFAGKFYLADINYRNAVGEARIENLEKAVRSNPYQPQYKIILARAYLGQVLSEFQKPVEEQDQIAISNNVQLAITYAKGGQIGRIYVRGATELEPNRVTTWETLGMIYRDIRGLATGALEWGIKAFEKAISLEPTNPVLHTELGKLYLTQGEIQKAREKFAKARELKPDYVDALLQEAFIYEQENNLPEAIRKMEKAASSFPFNIEILFQLGRLYFNNNQVDEAISQFESVLILMPNHSNALYSLGVAYQRKGEKEKAITAFEKCLQLNPDNQDVIRKLEELRE